MRRGLAIALSEALRLIHKSSFPTATWNFEFQVGERSRSEMCISGSSEAKAGKPDWKKLL